MLLHFTYLDLFNSSSCQVNKLYHAQNRAEQSSARKMARPVHGLLRPLLLAVCCLLLLQVSECSRPPSPSPADDHLDDALHHQLLLLDAEVARTAGPPTCSTEVAEDGRTGAAAAAAAAAALSSAPATTPARAVGAVASSRPRQTSDRALVRAGRTPEVLLLRSKLARRFLAGAGDRRVDEAAASAVDGAAASCHSNNPHINCPPAWKP